MTFLQYCCDRSLDDLVMYFYGFTLSPRDVSRAQPLAGQLASSRAVRTLDMARKRRPRNLAKILASVLPCSYSRRP
jgi:hypothetical protein